MDEICSTCLSKHRTLVPLSSNEVNSSLQETIPFAGSPVLVCWECNSRLQKMRAFKSQARKAQELLKLYQENKETLKALRSLSRLSISRTKTDYDENIVHFIKQEPVECGDFQSEVKLFTHIVEIIPKTEKIDIEESPSKCMYYTVVPPPPPPESKDGDGGDSDEWPLTQVTDKTVKTEKKVKKIKRERKSDIKKEPKKKHKLKKFDRQLSEAKENFTIKIMSDEELTRLREEDRKNGRYMSYPFKCTTCITGYVLEENYNDHMLTKHSEDIGPHTCDICLTRHERADQLARHRELHFRRYHCRECPFNSHKLQWMLLHQSEHKVETFNCKICGFSTFTEGRLRYHTNKMHKKLPTCESCGQTFTSGHSLKTHMLMQHGNAKYEKCPVCGGMYRHLAIHARVHEPPAPDAICVECGVKFKNKNYLKHHLLSHSKHRQQNDVDSLKWYVCDECGYRSTNKTSLKRHKVSLHTKQFPYNCDICHKGFLRRDRLKYHILERHEGGELPRKNVCSHCGKAFKVKQVLINHIRIHTGERPYRCAHCPWTFTQRVTLRTHMRALHPGANTGNTANTGGAGDSGNTDDGKAEKSGTIRTHMRALHLVGANTGNTGGAGGSGNTDDGGKAEKSGKGAKTSRKNGD